MPDYAPLRVLQVLPALESGGVEKNTLDLLRFSASLTDNIEFHIASAGGSLVNETIERGAIHHTLPLQDRNPLRIMKNAVALKKLIQRNQINVVHARSRGPAWSALWAAKQCQVPLVTTYHGTYNAQNWAKRFYNSVMARGNRVIAISDFMKAHILMQHHDCNPVVETIHEGVDASLFELSLHHADQINKFRQQFGIQDSQKLLLLVGRLTRWKGQHILLEACAQLKLNDFVVMFIGDDQGRIDYKNELVSLAQTENITTHFIKSFQPLSLAYAAADIVFSCSTDPEAFGRITAEALCMERPFIGTNQGATIELSQQGKLADLVEPGKPADLAQNIQKVISTNQNILSKRGKEARNHMINHYGLESMCLKTIQLYKTLVNQSDGNTSHN